MQNRQLKFESSARLSELKPAETLKRIGLMDSHILCDIGAGSGIFTLPGAKMTQNTVYALEKSEEMLSIIRDKIRNENISNITLIKVEDERFAIADHSVDLALLVTVLHEITDKSVFLTEIKRILKDTGKLAIIEFHKQETPMGPPVDHRISKDETQRELEAVGLKKLDFYDLGDNYYCMIFGKRTEA